MYLLRTLSAKLATLNVPHQITTTDVLHDEIHSRLGLETSMQVRQERMAFPVGDQEYSLLRACALDLVVLNDELLLQDLDGIQPSGLLRFSQHDLAKVALA